MAATSNIDKTRVMGTAAFKKEINHLLQSASFTTSEGEIDPGWNSRDHALVMALMLKSADGYPKIASGKVMFVQGPVAGNAAFSIGQPETYKIGHSWLLHAKFGNIDLSPSLQTREHSFREPLNGIFNRVWLPPGKERTSVELVEDPLVYSGQIDKAMNKQAHSTAVYLHLDDFEVTDKLLESPFKFLGSRFSTEIKNRFGADFYPAVARHLHDFVVGKADSLTSLAKVQAWGAVFDARTNSQT
jgi:hypothetical protein